MCCISRDAEPRFFPVQDNILLKISRRGYDRLWENDESGLGMYSS